MTNMLRTIVSTLLIALLVGCATSATQQSMSITATDLPTKINSDLKGKVAVSSVTGGKDTNPMWTSQVDGQGFRGALDKSLAVAGYKATDEKAALFSVDAHINELDQPWFGMTFDVRSTVLYTIRSNGKQTQIPVTATGSASTSDAFVGVERLRIANERSIKENIRQFLQKIAELAPW